MPSQTPVHALSGASTSSSSTPNARSTEAAAINDATRWPLFPQARLHC
jgi:hypothetical protein